MRATRASDPREAISDVMTTPLHMCIVAGQAGCEPREEPEVKAGRMPPHPLRHLRICAGQRPCTSKATDGREFKAMPYQPHARPMLSLQHRRPLRDASSQVRGYQVYPKRTFRRTPDGCVEVGLHKAGACRPGLDVDQVDQGGRCRRGLHEAPFVDARRARGALAADSTAFDADTRVPSPSFAEFVLSSVVPELVCRRRGRRGSRFGFVSRLCGPVEFLGVRLGRLFRGAWYARTMLLMGFV